MPALDGVDGVGLDVPALDGVDGVGLVVPTWGGVDVPLLGDADGSPLVVAAVLLAPVPLQALLVTMMTTVAIAEGLAGAPSASSGSNTSRRSLEPLPNIVEL